MEKKTSMRETNHVFYVVHQDGFCIVASVNVLVGSWAVYKGLDLEGVVDWYVVRQGGDKVRQEEAAKLFPECAAKYRWRA